MCGLIRASVLGRKGGERCHEDGGEGQQQQIGAEGIKRQRSIEKKKKIRAEGYLAELYLWRRAAGWSSPSQEVGEG